MSGVADLHEIDSMFVVCIFFLYFLSYCAFCLFVLILIVFYLGKGGKEGEERGREEHEVGCIEKHEGSRRSWEKENTMTKIYSHEKYVTLKKEKLKVGRNKGTNVQNLK